MKDRQHNGQKKKDTTIGVTRTPLRTSGELMFSGRVGSSFSTSDIRRVNLVTNPVIKFD